MAFLIGMVASMKVAVRRVSGEAEYVSAVLSRALMASNRAAFLYSRS